MKISSILRSALCALILFSGVASAQKPAVKEVKTESRAAAVQPLRDVYEGIVGSIKNQSLRDDVTTMFSPFFAGQYPSQYAHSLRVFAQQIHADATIKDELKNAIQDLTDEVLAVVAVEEKSWWQRRSTLEKAGVIGGSVVGAAVIVLLIAQLLKRRAAAKENSFAQLGEEVARLKAERDGQALAAREAASLAAFERLERAESSSRIRSVLGLDVSVKPKFTDFRTRGSSDWLNLLGEAGAEERRAATRAIQTRLAAEAQEARERAAAEALLAAQERAEREAAEQERAEREAREVELARINALVAAGTATLEDLQEEVGKLKEGAAGLTILAEAIAKIEREQAEAQAVAKAQADALRAELAAAEQARAAELEELQKIVDKARTSDELVSLQEEVGDDADKKRIVLVRRHQLFQAEVAALEVWADKASLSELRRAKGKPGLPEKKLKVVRYAFLHKLLSELQRVAPKMDHLNQEVGAFEGSSDLTAVEALKARVRALKTECADLSCTREDMDGGSIDLNGQILALEGKVDSGICDDLIRSIDEKQGVYASSWLGLAAISAAQAADTASGALTVVTNTALGTPEERAAAAEAAKKAAAEKAEADRVAAEEAAARKEEVAAFKTELARSSLRDIWEVVKAQTDPDYKEAAQEVYTASATAALEPIETKLTIFKMDAPKSRSGWVSGATITDKIYPDDRLLSQWDTRMAGLKASGENFDAIATELARQFAEWPKEKFVTGTTDQLAAIAAAAPAAREAYVRSLHAELEDCAGKKQKMTLAVRALDALLEKLAEEKERLGKEAGFADSAAAKLAGRMSAATKKGKVEELQEEIAKLLRLAQGKLRSIDDDITVVRKKSEETAVDVEHAKRESHVRSRQIEVASLDNELTTWKRSGAPLGYSVDGWADTLLGGTGTLLGAGLAGRSLAKITRLITEIGFERDTALETAFDVLGVLL